jgi:Tfp pilus assembly protein PilX
MKRRTHPARAQRGYMIAIVLVALVAMMISGIALVRSMDTNQLVAGNLAFRSSTPHSADAGVQAAVTWLEARAAIAGGLDNNATANGYYASSTELNYDDPGLWTACASCNSNDAAGNQVSWIVQRMCTAQGSPGTPGVLCGSFSAAAAGADGNSMRTDGNQFTGVSRNYYRITVRVAGPRNTGTLVQSFVTL